MKSEGEKLFLEGGLPFHIDLVYREAFGYLGIVTPIVTMFFIVLMETLFDKKQ